MSVGIIRKRVMSMSVIRPRSQLASRGLSPADVQMTEGSLCDSLNLLRSSLCSRTRFWNQSLLEIFRSERHRRAQSKNTAPGKPKATPQQQQQQQPNIAKKVSKELPVSTNCHFISSLLHQPICMESEYPVVVVKFLGRQQSKRIRVGRKLIIW